MLQQFYILEDLLISRFLSERATVGECLSEEVIVQVSATAHIEWGGCEDVIALISEDFVKRFWLEAQELFVFAVGGRWRPALIGGVSCIAVVHFNTGISIYVSMSEEEDAITLETRMSLSAAAEGNINIHREERNVTMASVDFILAVEVLWSERLPSYHCGYGRTNGCNAIYQAIHYRLEKYIYIYIYIYILSPIYYVKF
eukprot:Gb_19595 [translate_table: standard]